MRYATRLIPLFVFLTAPLAALAEPMPVHWTTSGLEMDADGISGYRSTDDTNQLIVDGELRPAADDGGFLALQWDITKNTDYTWHYQYTVTGTDLDSISHFTLQLSEGAFGSVTNAKITVNYADQNKESTTAPESGESLKLEATDGSAQNTVSDQLAWAAGSVLKFDEGIEGLVEDAEEAIASVIYEFDIDRVAVWGNLFVKDGQWSVYNAGSGLEDSSTDVNQFIAVPDTVSVIPEPATVTMWSLLGLIGIGFIRRRR